MSLDDSNSGGPATRTLKNKHSLQERREHEAPSKVRPARKLKAEEREAFYAEALEGLRNQNDSSNFRYVVSMLIANDELLRALGDLSLKWEHALGLARAAMEAQGMVDVLLARHLCEIAASMGTSEYDAESKRLMQILAEISTGTRILPCLMTLARPANPTMQSKAVLMIGRIKRSVKWVLGRLSDSDPRVRANAIEALWGEDTPEVRHVLRLAARDRHNRVAGNALVALYRVGDVWALAEVIKMVAHESPTFRSTAAWIMGEVRDPRFKKVLGRLVGEPDLTVRTRAFTALKKIRVATAESRESEESKIVARFGRKSTSDWQKLNLAVISSDGQELAGVLPTQLILTEDGRDVVNYSMEEQVVAPAIAVSFVFPGSSGAEEDAFQKGARNALALKREPDLWAVTPYRTTTAPELPAGFVGETITIPVVESSSWLDVRQCFVADPEKLGASFSEPPPAGKRAELWSTIRGSVQPDQTLAKCQRHVVLHTRSETGRPDDFSEITSAAITSQTIVHAVSRVANPAIEALCSSSGGSFEIVASEDELMTAVEDICFGFQARYKADYQAAGDARELRIAVNSPGGWGETKMAIPEARRAVAE